MGLQCLLGTDDCRRRYLVTHDTYSTGDSGRGARVRTGGLLLPKQARYQAAPRPDTQTPSYHNHPVRRNQTSPEVVCFIVARGLVEVVAENSWIAKKLFDGE